MEVLGGRGASVLIVTLRLTRHEGVLTVPMFPAETLCFAIPVVQ